MAVHNADLVVLHTGLTYLLKSLAVLVSHVAAFAALYRVLPTLGFTHFQPGWQTRDAVDPGAPLFLLKSVYMTPRCDTYRICCGICAHRPASILALFDGDHDKVE